MTNPILPAGESVFNQAVVANAAILAGDVRPTQPRSTYRITVSLSAAVKFGVVVKKSATTFTTYLKNGDAIPASAVQTFVLGVTSEESYNFTVDGNATVQKLQVDEVLGGVI